jgi:hypothetical protein
LFEEKELSSELEFGGRSFLSKQLTPGKHLIVVLLGQGTLVITKIKIKDI